jgi:hypothetical protein
MKNGTFFLALLNWLGIFTSHKAREVRDGITTRLVLKCRPFVHSLTSSDARHPANTERGGL